MKKLLSILIATSNMLLLASKHDLEYTKDTCNRTWYGRRPPTNEERADCYECSYSRFEALDKDANKYVAHIAYNPSRCYIEYLLVDDEYQRQGIGKELAQRALEDLIKHGCEDVALFSVTESIGFWEKLGARPKHNGDHVFYNLQPDLPKKS